MRMFRYVVPVGLALVLATPALAGDIIVLKSGRKYGNPNSNVPPTESDYAESKMTIVEENLDKIVFRLEGVPTPQELEAGNIDVTYHDPSLAPTALLRGKRLLGSGQYEDAFAMFEEVTGDARAPKWAQAEAGYRLGEVLWMAGALDDAAKAFDSFLGTWKKSKYVPSATQANARIKLEKGDVEGARAAFAALKKMSGLPEAESLEIDYWINWIDEKVALQKNDKAGLEKALKGYENLARSLKSRKGMEDLHGKCLVGAISCKLGLGQHAEGQADATKVVEEYKDPLVRAGAHTLLGRAIVLQNAGSNDKAAYKTALLHFLKVVTLYGNEPGAEEWMAESLFRSGELFNELRPAQAKTEEDKAAVLMARLRARREFQECIQRFPRSEWAQKARRAMGGS
jgi:tetratricopeptide (TPR) repeat protein